MPFTDKSWDGAASKYRDTDAYCGACLIDLNAPGAEKTQANCKLPVKERRHIQPECATCCCGCSDGSTRRSSSSGSGEGKGSKKASSAHAGSRD